MAIREEVAACNPCLKISKKVREKIPARNKRDRFMSLEEEDKLFNLGLVGLRAHFRPIVRLGVHLGARPGQLMALNRADINIPGGMPPEVAVLDVERDGAKPPEAPEKPLVINLNLDIDAPNRILIDGRGLDAEMGGNLKVRGTTATPVVSGGFELQRGFFTLANSKLTFTNGSVTFSGMGLQKKLDPSLDFTAQTKAAEITAVVHITGLADAPQIELTSTPELPQDEILARLLFGEPAAQLTALQLVQTGAALASLRGGGGSSLNPDSSLMCERSWFNEIRSPHAMFTTRPASLFEVEAARRFAPTVFSMKQKSRVCSPSP